LEILYVCFRVVLFLKFIFYRSRTRDSVNSCVGGQKATYLLRNAQEILVVVLSYTVDAESQNLLL